MHAYVMEDTWYIYYPENNLKSIKDYLRYFGKKWKKQLSFINDVIFVEFEQILLLYFPFSNNEDLLKKLKQ